MMIVPLRDRDLIRIYQCGACTNIFLAQADDSHLSCAVAHPPGSCCHYGEIRVSVELIAEIQKLLSDAPLYSAREHKNNVSAGKSIVGGIA